MADEEHKKLHPILDEITQTYVDLYTNRPNEKNREQLIKLEEMLHQNLERILAAKEVGDKKGG